MKRKICITEEKIDVYLAKPLEGSTGIYLQSGPDEIAIIRNRKLLATKALDSNVIELATEIKDKNYCFSIVKKFL